MNIEPASATSRQKEHNWLHEERKVMLQFVQNVKHFEEPTSEIYYSLMIEFTKLPITWRAAKKEMDDLKKKFILAKSLLQFACGLSIVRVEHMSVIMGKILEICPLYDKLGNIFANSGEPFLPPEIMATVENTPNLTIIPIPLPVKVTDSKSTSQPLLKRENPSNAANGLNEIVQENEQGEGKPNEFDEVAAKRLKLDEEQTKKQFELQKIKVEEEIKMRIEIKRLELEHSN